MKGNFCTLVRSLRRGTFVLAGRGENRRTLIHEDDVGRAAVLAAESEAVVGSVFNVTDGSVHTMAEIVASICKTLGRKPPRFHLPLSVVRAVAFGPVRALLDKYVEDLAVDGSRFQQVTGFVPCVDLQSGWQRALKTACK